MTHKVTPLANCFFHHKMTNLLNCSFIHKVTCSVQFEQGFRRCKRMFKYKAPHTTGMTRSPVIKTIQQGFTMLELLIVIAIVGIVIGVSAANFIPMIDRTNTREAASLLKANMDFARGESIVRGGWVAICGSADGQSCQDSYDDGWVVFHDLDRDGSLGKADTILNKTQQKNVLQPKLATVKVRLT